MMTITITDKTVEAQKGVSTQFKASIFFPEDGRSVLAFCFDFLIILKTMKRRDQECVQWSFQASTKMREV